MTLKVIGNGSENPIRLTGLSIRPNREQWVLDVRRGPTVEDHEQEASGEHRVRFGDHVSLFDQPAHRNSPAAGNEIGLIDRCRTALRDQDP